MPVKINVIMEIKAPGTYAVVIYINQYVLTFSIYVAEVSKFCIWKAVNLKMPAC